MYPETNNNNQLHRSLSNSQAPAAPMSSNVSFRRAVSVPYISASLLEDDGQKEHFKKIDNLLEAVKADIDEFIHLYPSVWNVHLPPGVSVTLQLADALRLLPETRGLATATTLTANHIQQIQHMLSSMTTILPSTIDPAHGQDHVVLDHVLPGHVLPDHVLHDQHGQVGDLLARASHDVSSIIVLLNVWNPPADKQTGQGAAGFESPSIASARAVLAAAVVIQAFVKNVQQNWDRIVI